MPSGAAHETWDAQSLSATAPTGRIKFSEVATQIQYFVVLAIGSGDRKPPLRLFGKFVFYVGYRDRTAKTLNPTAEL
jgi:hypothetical protein